MVIDKYDII